MKYLVSVAKQQTRSWFGMVRKRSTPKRLSAENAVDFSFQARSNCDQPTFVERVMQEESFQEIPPSPLINLPPSPKRIKATLATQIHSVPTEQVYPITKIFLRCPLPNRNVEENQVLQGHYSILSTTDPNQPIFQFQFHKSNLNEPGSQKVSEGEISPVNILKALSHNGQTLTIPDEKTILALATAVVREQPMMHLNAKM